MLKKLGIGCAVVILLALVLVALGSQGGRQKAGLGVPVPAETILPRATQSVPSPVEASLTAVPSVTSAIPAEVSIYAAKILPPLDEYARALYLLSEQSNLAGTNPGLLVNQTWRLKTAGVLASLNVAGKQLGSVQPVPVQMRKIDELMIKIARETPLMVDDYAAGVDKLDSRLIESSATRLRRINGWINEARVEVDQIIARK